MAHESGLVWLTAMRLGCEERGIGFELEAVETLKEGGLTNRGGAFVGEDTREAGVATALHKLAHLGGALTEAMEDDLAPIHAASINKL